MPAEQAYGLEDLLRVMERLRDPEHGCPWDLKQDFRTIAPSTLEEAYELVEAIEHEDFPHVAEELGDLLFQVIFYTQMGRERGLFDLHQVIDTLVDKLLRRHPHVFAGGNIEGIVDADASVAEVKQSWEAIKREERAARAQHGALDDVPVALPAISRAQKLQKRAATVGFDWSDVDGVMDKLHEEIAELQEADSAAAREEELGDLIFTCINLGRHLGVDSEAALRRASSKFEARFNTMEARITQAGQRVEEVDSETLNKAWEAAKKG
ncbi:MAG: nucleoside triphosphate pyrophosphohydrolase [Pseudomonadota bacterium]